MSAYRKPGKVTRCPQCSAQVRLGTRGATGETLYLEPDVAPVMWWSDDPYEATRNLTPGIGYLQHKCPERTP